MYITLWPESVSELYRQSDRRLSAKMVPTFADRGCRVVSAAEPYGCNLGFLDRISLTVQEVNKKLKLLRKLVCVCVSPKSTFEWLNQSL
jgi:hypothetical protein